MRVLLAFALAFASVLAVQDGQSADSHVMFNSWLQQQTSAPGSASAKPTATGAAASSYYEEAETETAVLKVTGYQNCRCIGCTNYCKTSDCATAGPCCATAYGEVTVSCSPDNDNYHGDSYDGQGNHHQTKWLPSMDNLDIGTCSQVFYGFPRSDPVVVNDAVIKVGTFTTVCNLNSGSQCAHPFCDSMVLTWTGTTYVLKSVVSKTQPVLPPFDAKCLALAGQRGEREVQGFGGLAASLPKLSADKAPPKAAAAHTAYYKDGPTTYYEGSASIFTGPVTITSSKYNIKYKEGFMDYAEMPSGTPITPSEAAGKHLVDPFALILQVQKAREYY